MLPQIKLQVNQSVTKNLSRIPKRAEKCGKFFKNSLVKSKVWFKKPHVLDCETKFTIQPNLNRDFREAAERRKSDSFKWKCLFQVFSTETSVRGIYEIASHALRQDGLRVFGECQDMKTWSRLQRVGSKRNILKQSNRRANDQR